MMQKGRKVRPLLLLHASFLKCVQKKNPNRLVVEYQPFVMSQGAPSPLAGQCQHFRAPVLFNMNMCLIVKDHPVDFTHST